MNNDNNNNNNNNDNDNDKNNNDYNNKYDNIIKKHIAEVRVVAEGAAAQAVDVKTWLE